MTTRVLGIVALLGTALLLWSGLLFTPQDQVQGDLVRMIYIHPALAWTCYEAFGLAAAASALYLFPRTRNLFWDQLAGAASEVGLVFCGLTLATGSIWGRSTWGVWWTWDARLTTTALLFTLFLGYGALRRVSGDAGVRAKRCAIAALIASLDVPVVHLSVQWWRTLHQGRTLLRSNPSIHGSQLATLLLGFVVLTVIFAWMMVHRFRLERLVAQYETVAIDLALAQRRSESHFRESASPLSDQSVGATS